MSASVEIEFGGETLHLLAERAAWWPRARAIIIADLHLGKASTFRSAGVPLPEGHSDHDLRRLSHLIGRHDARHAIILGDLLHARSGVGPATLDALDAFRHRHPASTLRVTLVRGNHDRSAGDPPTALGFEACDEPCELPCVMTNEPASRPASDRACAPTALRFAHDPAAAELVVPGEHVLCGHLHPAVSLAGDACVGAAMRPACFWCRRATAGGAGGMLVLPAFGTFTGARAIRPREGDRVFAVGPEGEECVVEIKPRKSVRV